MRIQILDIKNFRGIASGHVVFRKHSLLVGGNNIGKSTVCEALELVLGPERIYHRPIIDEHDFYCGSYQRDDGYSLEIVIRVVLTDLNHKQQLRFCQHLRRWDKGQLKFVDEEADGISHADGPNVDWALPVVFIGRYDPEEDDFIGDTFFDHPMDDPDSLSDEEKASLGQGRSIFTRAHKRDCGFIYLRALRTGSRALSLQRGSLLDTILRLGEQGSANMWPAALRSLKELDPAIGEKSQLGLIRAQLQERLGRFINLASEGDQTSFYASDLTRDNLREVVKLFVATWPSNYPVPFSRQGTGSVNLLVFALLTMIADLKEENSAIFVMEEPEIALPPHIQCRVVKYVLQEMGQSIVTSHSPYIIEQYEAENVVVLGRDDKSCFGGKPIDRSLIKQKTIEPNAGSLQRLFSAEQFSLSKERLKWSPSTLHRQRSKDSTPATPISIYLACHFSTLGVTRKCQSMDRSLKRLANRSSACETNLTRRISVVKIILMHMTSSGSHQNWESNASWWTRCLKAFCTVSSKK